MQIKPLLSWWFAVTCNVTCGSLFTPWQLSVLPSSWHSFTFFSPLCCVPVFPFVFIDFVRKRAAINRKKGQAELETCPALTYFCLEMEGQISSTKDPWLVKMKGHIKTVQVWSCQKAMCGCLLQSQKEGEDWRVSSSIPKLLKMSSSPSEPQHFRNTLFGCHIMKALGDYISLRHKTHFIILGIRIFWTSFISWFKKNMQEISFESLISVSMKSACQW